MGFLQIVINWFKNNISILFLSFLLILFSELFNRIFKSDFLKLFFKKHVFLFKKIKYFIGKFFIFTFFVTLIPLIFLHVLQREVFPNFISNLAIASLALGAFTVAMANLVNSKEISEESIRYRHLAEDFISSGIFFIFSYFFWIVVIYNEKNPVELISGLIFLYSIFTIISLMSAIIYLISGMWKLLNENN